MPHSIETRATRQISVAHLLLLCVALWLAGCEPHAPVKPADPPTATPVPAPDPAEKPAIVQQPPALEKPDPVSHAVLTRTEWQTLPDWQSDDPAQAWNALLAGCRALKNQEAWRGVCTATLQIASPDRDTARRFFESNFTPYRLSDPDGGDEGLITGYYEPLLRGSRKPSGRYRHALYGVPDDLLAIDLGGQHPELKNLRLRGRREGGRVVPYYDRAQIESGKAAVRGREIVWVDDAIELFFLQIQGSGRVRLDNGEMLHVGYADHNGHPYRSIGRRLVERGELPLEQASMQGIKAWARRNPGRLTELLHHNPRYVFFRELPAGLPGPPGALGVPLTAERSVAVDPRYVPLGAPVYLATTWPNSAKPLNRLMLAQDTGSAILGAVRADFFWGFGDAAAREAGRMKQPLRMWVLLPNDYPVPAHGR
ncbi:MAG: MltA domain-containing protein [Burkholderiales bacterium]|nr:MltA domain-containing protein [Burkholderiales bacterium]